jgi:2-succinyl-5-enolpyruvyl-6-hydroxy-3-cyclohexene-1-carboxylate synthase
MGDLTFLHDASSLAIDPLDGELNIQVIVGNDHGGTIFESLEMAKDLAGASFTRLFKTPQTANIKKLAEAYGWNHVLVETKAQLVASLGMTGRVVIEVDLT